MQISETLAVSWRNLGRRRGRSVLTVTGIAVGVAAIVFLVSLMGGLEAQFISIAERGGADLIVVQKESGDLMLTKLKEDVTYELLRVTGVSEVSPTLFVLTRVSDYPYMIVCGLKVDSFTANHYEVVQGRMLTREDRGKILLGRKASAILRKGLGEIVTLVADEYEVVGIYETGISFEDSGGVAPLDEVQRTFDQVGLVSYFEVKTQGVANLEETRANILHEVAGVDVQVPQEVASKQEDFQLIKSVTSMVSVVAVAFGAIITMNTMVMSIYERTREIGILRAVGWSKRSILLMVMEETMLLALVGGAIGTALAMSWVYALNNLATIPLSVQVNVDTLLSAVLSVLCLGVLGGLYPAIRAARMDPIEALGHEV